MEITAFLVVGSRLFCSMLLFVALFRGPTLSPGVNQLYAFGVGGTVPSYSYKESGPSFKKKILLKTRRFRTQNSLPNLAEI